jgi:hypothetical protein
MARLPDCRGAGLLLLVLIIMAMGLVAGMLTVSVRLAWDERATTETQAKMRVIAEAISGTNFASGGKRARHYEQDVGALPSSLNDLLSRPVAVGTCFITTAAQNLSGWCGPYWTSDFSGENAFSDGWNNTLGLSTSPRQVRSRGPDGADNSGAGDDVVQPY